MNDRESVWFNRIGITRCGLPGGRYIKRNNTSTCGEIGELILKGPQVMQAYYQIPHETAQTLRDGWLYTGDIVRMDQEGYFYVGDRKKLLIK